MAVKKTMPAPKPLTDSHIAQATITQHDIIAKQVEMHAKYGRSVCEECIKTKSEWLHLRECLVCGHVGCCEQSPNQHAHKHFEATTHPVIQSFQPNEDWQYCYAHEAFVPGREWA